MTLQKQTISLPLTGGIDAKTDPFLNNTFITLDNIYQKKTGSLVKRTGYATLSQKDLSEATVAEADDLFIKGQELLISAGGSLYSYANAKDRWIYKGVISGTTGSSLPLVNGFSSINQVDYVESNGVGLTVYIDSYDGKLYADTIDKATGAKFGVRVLLTASTATSPIAVAVDEYLFAVWAEGANIKSARFSTAAPATYLDITTTISDGNATPSFDACKVGAAIIVAYRASSGNLKVAYITKDNLAGSPINGFPNPYLFPMAISGAVGVCSVIIGNTEAVSVGYYSSSFFKCLTFYSDLTLIDNVSIRGVTAATNRVGMVAAAGIVFAVYSIDSSPTVTYTATRDLNTFVTINQDVVRQASVVASRPFIDNTGVKVFLGHNRSGSVQESLFLFDLYNGVVAGRFYYQLAGVVISGVTRNALQSISFDGTNYIGAFLKKTRVGEDLIPIYSAQKLSVSTSAVRQAQETANDLIISGGFAQRYDGNAVTELGFLMGPDAITFTQATTGGSISNGTYRYVAVYEWVDASGNYEYSLPSPILTATVNGGGSIQAVTVTVPYLAWTQKTSRPPILALYRTENNGTIFYKVSSDTSPTYNVATGNTTTIVDTLADASLLGKQLLYTTGNVIENVPPPSFTTIAMVKQRLFVGGGDCGDRIYYTKRFTQGTVPEFSDALYLQVGVNVTALAELDDKLIAFGDNSTYVISGDGPEPTGANNSFSAPFKVSADVGCSRPDTITTIPQGLMFVSQKGIFLLDRGMMPTYIGAQAELANSLDINSAVVIPTTQELLLTSREGVTHRYDWFYQKWTTISPQASLASDVWQNKHVWLGVDGIVRVKDAARWLDGSKTYNSKIETGWMQMAGVSGFQRIWSIVILGRYVGNHKLVVKLSYDHQDYVSEVLSIEPNAAIYDGTYGDKSYGVGNYGGSEDGVYRFQVRPSTQKCRAIKISIEDTFTGTATEGSFELVGVSLVVGLKPSHGKVASNRRLS